MCMQEKLAWADLSWQVQIFEILSISELLTLSWKKTTELHLGWCYFASNVSYWAHNYTSSVWLPRARELQWFTSTPVPISGFWVENHSLGYITFLSLFLPHSSSVSFPIVLFSVCGPMARPVPSLIPFNTNIITNNGHHLYLSKKLEFSSVQKRPQLIEIHPQFGSCQVVVTENIFSNLMAFLARVQNPSSS